MFEEVPPVHTKWGYAQHRQQLWLSMDKYHAQTHTHRFGVCNFKARISLAPALVWHTVWQSLKSLLHTLVVSRLQNKQTTTGGIKVCVTACASYLQHSAFCSLRIFMAVRYAENLTLFRSATGRDRDREMKGGWTKRKQRQKIRSATEIC